MPTDSNGMQACYYSVELNWSGCCIGNELGLKESCIGAVRIKKRLNINKLI